MKGPLAFLHVEGMPRASLEEARMLLRALESRFSDSPQAEWLDIGADGASPEAIATCRRADAVFLSELSAMEPGARRQLSWRLRRELAVPARVRPLRGLRNGPDVLVVSDDGEVEAADAQDQRIHAVTRVAAELAQRRWGLVTLVRPPVDVPGMEGWEARAREAATQVPSLRCEVVTLEEVLRRMASAPGSLDVLLTEGRVADTLVQTQEAQGVPEAYLAEGGRGFYPLNGQGPQGVLSVTLALRCSLRLDREAVGVERALAAALTIAQGAASGVEGGRVWEAVRAHLISDVTTSLAI